MYEKYGNNVNQPKSNNIDNFGSLTSFNGVNTVFPYTNIVPEQELTKYI